MTEAVAAVNQRKLRRAPGVVAGVCAGLAESLGLNVAFVRFAFCLLGIANGFAVVAYLFLWWVMPAPDGTAQTPAGTRNWIEFVHEHAVVKYAVASVALLATLFRMTGDLVDIAESARKLAGFVGAVVQPSKADADAVPEPPLDRAQLEATLRQVVLAADQAEIVAQTTLDPGLLSQFFGAEQLIREQAGILEAIRTGMQKQATLERHQFQEIRVNAAGDRAEVDVIETWKSVVYARASGNCVEIYPAHDMPQTADLARGADGWKVVNIAYRPSVTPEPLPCAAAQTSTSPQRF